MKKVDQKTQFTFRIEGSFRQLIEHAFSEEDARRQLAERILKEAGSEVSEEALNHVAIHNLRLVNTR